MDSWLTVLSMSMSPFSPCPTVSSVSAYGLVFSFLYFFVRFVSGSFSLRDGDVFLLLFSFDFYFQPLAIGLLASIAINDRLYTDGRFLPLPLIGNVSIKPVA